jgi:CHRD domain-containing protein
MHRISLRSGVAALALAVLLVAGSPALAETVAFKAELKGANEVPPIDSKGTGTVTATYDTASKKLSWKISYSGLTGNATAAHFHGPADRDKNAAVVVPIIGSVTSPIEGSATLTEAQAADFMAGRWYFNIHTAAHAPGEIRGQMLKGM